MSSGSLGLTDPRVPGVALLADAGALAAILAAAGEELRECGYLRYKRGTSLIAGLRLASGPAFAFAVSDPARPKLVKTVHRAPAGALIWRSPRDGVLIARPPADRDLPALANPARWAAVLPAADPADPADTAGAPEAADPADPTGAGWATLAYKPQRRWVGRCLDRAGEPLPGVVRAYRRADMPGALAGWRLGAALADRLSQAGPQRGVPRLARLRSKSARRGVAVTSWLPGVPLDQGLRTGRIPPAARPEILTEVGRCLALLHQALPARDDHARDDHARDETARPADGLRAAHRVVVELAAVRPDLGDRALGLVRRLAGRAPRVCLTRPIHGDFSADQVIVGSGGSVGFTDWDRAGWGDPAADLGSLRSAGLDDAAYADVLAGYRLVRDAPDAIDWYTAVAGLQRLTDPLRRCRPDWQTLIADRLTEVERLAAECLPPARCRERVS